MSSEFGQLNRNFSYERDIRTPFASKSPQFNSKRIQFSKVSPFASTSKFNEYPFNLNQPIQNEYQYQAIPTQPNIRMSEYILIKDVKEKNIKAIIEFLKEYQIVSYNYDKDFGLIIRFSSEENAYRYLIGGPKSINDIYNNEAIILNCQFFFIDDDNENYGKLIMSSNRKSFNENKKYPNTSLGNLNEIYVEKSLLNMFLDVFLNR